MSIEIQPDKIRHNDTAEGIRIIGNLARAVEVKVRLAGETRVNLEKLPFPSRVCIFDFNGGERTIHIETDKEGYQAVTVDIGDGNILPLRYTKSNPWISPPENPELHHTLIIPPFITIGRPFSPELDFFVGAIVTEIPQDNPALLRRHYHSEEFGNPPEYDPYEKIITQIVGEGW